MTIEELTLLIAKGESETLELKETTGQRVEACKTLCAFLNKDGGKVVFGVSRKGVLTGQMVSDKTKRELFEVFAMFEPAVDVETEWVEIDATHQAIVCSVGRGNCRPYAYEGRPYKRVQSSTTVMPQEEYARMFDKRRGYQSDWERQINERLTLSDLDLDEVRKTAQMGIAEGRLPPNTNVHDAMRLLEGFKVCENGKLRNAAAVLFCNDSPDYSQCLLRLARFKGVDKSIFIDNKQIRGNVFRLIDAGITFCFNHLSLSGKIDGVYREEHLEIPVKVIREALVNALAHRLYVRSGTSVSLAIYDDRIEIINPGCLPPGATIEKLEQGNLSEPRNPIIAWVMYCRRMLESWGRGIKLIIEECANAGLHKPQIVSDECGYVKVVLWRPVGPKVGLKIGLKNISLDDNYSPEKGKTTQETTLQTTQENSIEPSHNLISQPHKSGGNLISQPHKSTSYVDNPLLVRLVSALNVERSAAELRVALNIKHQTDLLRRYIRPAMKAGLIEYTIPEKPRSRLQKYRLTALGRSVNGNMEK